MCAKYGFEKPNDRRALDLMNAAAKAVVSDLPEITIAYGVSDEYRSVLAVDVKRPILMVLVALSSIKHLLYSKEEQGISPHLISSSEYLLSLCSKLVSTVVSTFTANYVHQWSTYFPDTPLTSPLPTFDGRAVCYPSIQNLRDYLSWRQVDCEADKPPMIFLYD